MIYKKKVKEVKEKYVENKEKSQIKSDSRGSLPKYTP